MRHIKMVSRELPGMAILTLGSWGQKAPGISEDNPNGNLGKSGTLGFNELGDFVFFFTGVFETIAARLGFPIN